MCLAIPGKIESIAGDDSLSRSGKVNFGGIIKEVNLAYVPEAVVGDYVIVHVGFAISKVHEDEAKRTYESLREMSQLDELDWMRETADLGLAAFDRPEAERGGDA